MTRVGAAGIEILRDAYFYKPIDGNDMDIIAFFRTTRPLANMTAAILSAGILLFLPLSSVFFVVAVMLFFSLWSAYLLSDTL